MKRGCFARPRDMVAGGDIQHHAHHVDVFSGELDDVHGGKADRGPLDAR